MRKWYQFPKFIGPNLLCPIVLNYIRMSYKVLSLLLSPERQLKRLLILITFRFIKDMLILIHDIGR